MSAPEWLVELVGRHHHLPPMQTHDLRYAENACSCKTILARPRMAGDWAAAEKIHDAHVADATWDALIERVPAARAETIQFDTPKRQWMRDNEPQRSRSANRGRYFWMPCPICHMHFGGNEWGKTGKLSSINDPLQPRGTGHGVGICPACEDEGLGEETLDWGALEAAE